MGALANPEEPMVKRAALLLCLIFYLMPVGFGDTQEEQAEFRFARLQYGNGYGAFGYGRRGSWMTDAWDADYKFMWGIDRMTNVKLSKEPHPVPIMDPELFNYPYIYAVEVGQMVLSQAEADRLREYLLRGGFWHCDDFWGQGEFRNFVAQIRKVFPDRRMEPLSTTHPVFHSFFDVDRVLQVPNIGLGQRYTMSGGRTPTFERYDDTEPGVYGISDDTGRLMLLITYNSDLGDAWEWMDDPYYPALFTGYAYRLGMNSIIYAMTH